MSFKEGDKIVFEHDVIDTFSYEKLASKGQTGEIIYCMPGDEVDTYIVRTEDNRFTVFDHEISGGVSC